MNEIARPAAPRLTSLAHGGGCGCKLAPSVLQELLRGQSSHGGFPQLLVGTETADDAAVWQVSDELTVVSTADFFTPVVDDPTDFGRIAATNAISDIYTMGGRPIMALAILGMPLGRQPTTREETGGPPQQEQAPVPAGTRRAASSVAARRAACTWMAAERNRCGATASIGMLSSSTLPIISSNANSPAVRSRVSIIHARSL